MAFHGLLSILLALPAVLPAADALSADERRKIGEAFTAYVEATSDAKRAEASDRMLKVLQDAARRRKAKPEDVLQFVSDLQQSLSAAGEWRTTGFPRGNEFEETIKVDGSWQGKCALRVPKAYDPKAKGWPLLFVLPDAGEDPRAALVSRWKHDGLRERTILVSPGMPKDTKDWPSLDGGIAGAMWTLGHAFGKFRVDRDRVFLVGNGEGAKFAFLLATLYPDRFAGVVLRGASPASGAFENLHGIPVLVAGAGDDAEALLGARKSLGGAAATSIPEEDLDAISRWIAEQARDPFPTEVRLVPAKDFTRNAYWLRGVEWEITGDPMALPVEKRPLVRAKVDREKNAVEFETSGVFNLTMLFTDALLDLDKPVTVTLNGRPWDGTLQRSLEQFLELSRRLGDPSFVYTAQRPFSPPPK